jgi:hypothetical protein
MNRGERRAIKRAEDHGAVTTRFMGASGHEAWGISRWKHHPTDQIHEQYIGDEWKMT